jgi:polysaccharide biosynthesis protein PslH
VARVLFLTQVLPYPPDAGPKVRQYHMLRYLARQHEVVLVSFVRDDDRPEAIRHLETICAGVHAVPMRRSPWRNLRAGLKGLVTGRPIVIVRDEIDEMRDTLDRVTRQADFEIIHADQLSMAGYGRWVAKRVATAATLLDEHNAVYLLTRQLAARVTNPVGRLIYNREAWSMAAYEAAMCRAFDAVLTVTQEDRGRLLGLFPAQERESLARKFTVIPICVEPAQPVPSASQTRPPGRLTILHMGTMFWPPNVAGVLWFAKEVLPIIHRELPDARFVIVGKSPPPEVKALTADPRIEVLGYVPDPAPYMAATDLFVVPLQVGEGMRVKILDAWSWGLPVVSTPVGAEGISVEAGKNILLAAEAGDFAAQAVRVLKDRALNEALRVAGRARVEANYSWQVVYQQVDQVYTQLLAHREARLH